LTKSREIILSKKKFRHTRLNLNVQAGFHLEHVNLLSLVILLKKTRRIHYRHKHERQKGWTGKVPSLILRLIVAKKRILQKGLSKKKLINTPGAPGHL
jgi:hypothetical protein